MGAIPGADTYTRRTLAHGTYNRAFTTQDRSPVSIKQHKCKLEVYMVCVRHMAESDAEIIGFDHHSIRQHARNSRATQTPIWHIGTQMEFELIMKKKTLLWFQILISQIGNPSQCYEKYSRTNLVIAISRAVTVNEENNIFCPITVREQKAVARPKKPLESIQMTMLQIVFSFMYENIVHFFDINKLWIVIKWL